MTDPDTQKGSPKSVLKLDKFHTAFTKKYKEVFNDKIFNQKRLEMIQRTATQDLERKEHDQYAIQQQFYKGIKTKLFDRKRTDSFDELKRKRDRENQENLDQIKDRFLFQPIVYDDLINMKVQTDAESVQETIP